MLHFYDRLRQGHQMAFEGFFRRGEKKLKNVSIAKYKKIFEGKKYVLFLRNKIYITSSTLLFNTNNKT